MRFLLIITALFNISFSINSQWVINPAAVNGMGAFPTISVPDCNTIIIAGGTINTPKIIRSTNGGGNFANITGNITGTELWCVWAKSADTIFTGNGSGVIWKTVNAGVNWTQAVTTGGSAGFINGIRFLKPEQKYGVAMSDAPTSSNPLMFKTSDGGITWVTQTVTSGGGATGSVSTVFIADSVFYGFGHSNNSRLSYTTNGGMNWTFLNVSLSGGSTYGVDCGPNKNCFVASFNSLPNIVKFNASGMTQTINIGSGVSGFPFFAWVHGTETCYLAGTTGSGGSIKKTNNTGANWQIMNTSGMDGIIGMDYTYLNSNVCAYALADDGTVLKLEEVVIGVQQINSEVPKNFLLEQNYPNPFNPRTNIKYSVPKTAGVTIKIYNTIGGLVSTIVDEHHSPGNYSVDFNADGLSSGIYYYTISAGEFVDTKKMVLVK